MLLSNSPKKLKFVYIFHRQVRSWPKGHYWKSKKTIYQVAQYGLRF